MAKINILSSKIYNRISAGEVIERPYFVVKELIENSIDAGATSILIEIENGGISSMRISDNGSGIEKSELEKAIMPHATSKIATLKDLDNITSLGFRGEALASIASVSKLTILSKTKSQEIGARLEVEGGDIINICDFATTDGTEITVKNLFYNTPVRAKFLHSERSEESEITNTIARFILSNPSVSFKYVSNNKVIYQSYGDGFESAMSCVYGVSVINDCHYIATEKHGIMINGYIGKPHFSKGNRSYQTVFLNGRYIVNQTIQASIANAYAPYLMKKQYPFYVLSINIPTEIVDVNVHPNKLDVRFQNNQIIYGSIYSVISKVLDGSGDALSIIKNNDKSKEITNENTIDYVTQNGSIFKSKLLNDEVKRVKQFDKVVFADVGAKSISNEKPEETIAIKQATEIDIFAENKKFLESLEKKKTELQAKINAEQVSIQIKNDLKFIGQALNTFLIFDDGIDMFIVDQHAAHERILFDEINNSFTNNVNNSTQPLLLPYILNVNNNEFNFLSEKCDVLLNMGIEISEFGRNSFKISAIPTYLSEINLQKFFDDVLSDLDGFKTLTAKELLMEKFAQKACKAAIKSGDKLSQSEIEIISDKIKQNMGLKCPHGRPVVIKISRLEIDKWFKRIV